MEAQGTPEVVGFGCRGPGDGRSLAFDTKQLYLEMSSTCEGWSEPRVS